MKYASIGSISHGTLLPADLIEAFIRELEYQIGRNKNSDDPDMSTVTATLMMAMSFHEIGVSDPDAESVLIEDLTDALQYFAPPYCYFGSSEGDGSDFGYWPVMSAINELPRVEDSDGAKALGEDAVFVNDHGNVTVYGGDGSVILEVV